MCHEVQVLGKKESSCPPSWAHHVPENLSSLCHFDSRPLEGPLLTTEKLFINRTCFLSIFILTFHLQFGSLVIPAPFSFFPSPPTLVSSPVSFMYVGGWKFNSSVDGYFWLLGVWVKGSSQTLRGLIRARVVLPASQRADTYPDAHTGGRGQNNKVHSETNKGRRQYI